MGVGIVLPMICNLRYWKSLLHLEGFNNGKTDCFCAQMEPILKEIVDLAGAKSFF